MKDDNTLSSKEWQLLLVLQELRSALTEQEKNQRLIEWVDKKIKDRILMYLARKRILLISDSESSNCSAYFGPAKS